jgi:hypothetical protein
VHNAQRFYLAYVSNFMYNTHMKQNTNNVTFALIPSVGCEIYVNGRLVETCSLAEKDARLAAHGHKATKAPRYGFSATGKVITKRGAS